MFDEERSHDGSEGGTTCGSPGLRSRGLPVLAVGTPAPERARSAALGSRHNSHQPAP